jgi:hypothetical protein
MIYGIYDLEIAKAIPPKADTDRLPGIEYCGGWADYANMGIACWALCFLDTEDWNISEPIGGTAINQFGEPGGRFLAHELISCGLSSIPIGGFNSKKFDDQLLEEFGFSANTSDFDILEMVLEAAGMAEIKYWELEPKRSYSLAQIANANGYQKTLSGEQAPIEWQRGNKEVVIDYCKNDVRIAAMTLQRLLQETLMDPNTGNLLLYPMPGIAAII